jgi:aryl-alcohol dehydrogenase-like predicted oxidoreductase
MNKNISRMGLGLAALGRPGYINLGHGDDLNENYDTARMESQTHTMLDMAYALGIRYFDAAQSYGKAETFLSSWLKKRQPKDLSVGSKWGYYYTADWQIDAINHEIKEHTIERLNAQWPESKSRLSPYLNLYQIHSATFESGVLSNKAVLDRLFEIKSEGTTIGLSVSGAKQAEVIYAALAIKFGEQLLFDSVQATYNILEQSAAEALKHASEVGLKVIIKEGVANGRLTERNEKAHYFSALEILAAKYDVGIDAISLAFIMSQPFVNMVLSGAATEEHLLSNVMAAELALEPKDLQMLENLKMNTEEYWTERAGMAWN